jgi:hypothetical protein
MNDLELAWIAGLLEGEGSFLINSKGQPKVSCSMTDEDVLLKLQSLCGGSICQQKAVKEHWKPIWIWYRCGLPAIELMQQLQPNMGTRRSAKIAEVLQKYNLHKQEVSDRRTAITENGKQAGLAYLEGQGSLRKIAKQFGVSQVTVLNHYRKLI